jgi:serine phosphatase RsbU (regulator of sigma subunit)
VSGKGVEAAGLTATIRSMAEALSRRGDDPGEVVTELNELLFERMPDAAIVTVLMAVIDAAGGSLRWTSAGHPPALLVSRDRRVRSLDDPDPPCAAFPATRYRTHVESFAPGDVLFAYTDGLLEARREGAWFDEAGIRQALLDALAEPPAEIARAVHAAARAWSAGRIDDDVAVAVVRRLPDPPPAG